MSHHTTIDQPMLSFTKVSMYLECPLKYKYQYEDKAPRTTNIHFVLGDAVHKALELNDNHFIATQKHLTTAKVVAHFNKVFKGSSVGVATSKELDSTKVLGKAMVTAYMKDVRRRKDYQPAVLEQEFKLSLVTVPVQFRGFIDLIMKDGYIRDRKTSKAEYKILVDSIGLPVVNPDTGNYIFDGDMGKKLQLVMYALWYRDTYKKKEKGLQYEVITKHKRGPRIQLIDIIVTEKEFEQAVELLGEVSQKIVNKEFPPIPGQACQWCEFKNKCPTQNGITFPFTFA